MSDTKTAADVLIAALTTHSLNAWINETGGGCTAVTVTHPHGQVIVADGFSALHLPEDHDAWAATPEVLDETGGILEQLPSIHAPEPPGGQLRDRQRHVRGGHRNLAEGVLTTNRARGPLPPRGAGRSHQCPPLGMTEVPVSDMLGKTVPGHAGRCRHSRRGCTCYFHTGENGTRTRSRAQKHRRRIARRREQRSWRLEFSVRAPR